jgi:hypothetical protein
MTVNEWFSSGCNYNDGVLLYKQQEKANKNFIKIFERKESMQNLMKLKYELQKYLAPTTAVSSTEKQTIAKGTFDIHIDSSPKKEESKYFRRILINQLPVELHGLYIQQKNDYMIYCSIKTQLNALTNVTDSFGKIVIGTDGLPKLKRQTKLHIAKATKFCLQIETLFDAIDKTWQIIDHYLETKEIVIIKETSYEDLSEGKLRDKLISIRSSITRQKKRKQLLTQKFSNAIANKFKIKYSRDLTKCKAKLMQLEQNKIKLIQLRDAEN